MTTKKQIMEQADRLGLDYQIWSPGDRHGTRYEFMWETFTSNVFLGAKEAKAFLDGFDMARRIDTL